MYGAKKILLLTVCALVTCGLLVAFFLGKKEVISDELVSNATIKLLEESAELYYMDLDEIVLAEGHRLIGSEVKDNQLYVYVNALYCYYKFNNKNELILSTATAGPLVLVFDIVDAANYRYNHVIEPPTGCGNIPCAEIVFPKSLVKKSLKHSDFRVEFYQSQIRHYLNSYTVVD